MKVSFDFKKDDVWNYGKHVTFSMPKFRRKMIINIVMVPILVCAIGYTKGFTLAGYLIYGGGLTVFYVFILFSILKGKVIKSNSGKGGPLCKHTVDLTINGVRETIQDREENHYWSEIQKVVEDKKYIYIHWSEIAAHVIPKKAFLKDGEAEFFFTTAMNHYNSASKKENP